MAGFQVSTEDSILRRRSLFRRRKRRNPHPRNGNYADWRSSPDSQPRSEPMRSLRGAAPWNTRDERSWACNFQTPPRFNRNTDWSLWRSHKLREGGGRNRQTIASVCQRENWTMELHAGIAQPIGRIPERDKHLFDRAETRRSGSAINV